MKLVLFDIDGTLLRSDGAGKRAIHHALTEVFGTTGPADYWFDEMFEPGPAVRPEYRELAQRLAEMTPPGMKAQIDVTITDDYPLAQVIVIISAYPNDGQG